ncbi:MAG TPA: hypothetical protein VFZ66_17340 [Herpetosiphonaceae bacterium]
MEVREAITAWREFYAAVANVGAALVGLVFVGVSIHLSRRPLDNATRMLGADAVINLLHPLLAALGMLLPVPPTVQGIGLLILALEGLREIARVAYVLARQPSRGSWLTLAYRCFVPLVAAAVLAVGALGLLAGWTFAVYAPAVFVFLMFIVGTQNAWDLLLGNREVSGAAPSDERTTRPRPTGR